MYQITGTIEGVAPILFSAWTEKGIEDIDTGATGGKFTRDERKVEAMQRVHRNSKGICLPRWNLKRCLLDGCARANLKEGRVSMVAYLKGTVFVDEDLLFGKDEPDFVLEVPGKRPPRTGGACLIRYPAFDAGWKLDFSLSIIDDRRPPEHIRRSLEEAGLLVGLGSWRPEYGRFVLTAWEVSYPK